MLRIGATAWRMLTPALRYNVRFATTTVKTQHIDKILIANRGEIACRVMRTAKEMGIRTVAVYSDADVNSMHVQMADESYNIGPPPSKESYLDMEKILSVAKTTGAQAIHPGYGFLSENELFADRCYEENISFIGPPSAAIRDMGSKSESKNIMNAADVPIVKGYHGENQDVNYLQAKAQEIGYPVLIKAVMGGGGKGMRVVESDDEFQDMLESAKNESRKSFGDDRVLVETYVLNPRHVEVQVFADSLGNCVYLFERDCSVQRRHQKVIEEAPAPGLTEVTRKAIGEAAVRAAKAVGYVGAGTVEFIMAENGTFYFMEMNTRLQVEHPVTEYITGTDLVEWQIKVASGQRLPKMQEELKIRGHAFEARIYAEDPENNFMPMTGTLAHHRPPPTSSSVRVDTGVRQGDVVSVYYDPMISKLIVFGDDREAALRKMVFSLRQYQVGGFKTNIGLLINIATNDKFRKGCVTTHFIEENKNDVLPEIPEVKSVTIAQAAVSLLLQSPPTIACINSQDSASPWSGTPFYVNGKPSYSYEMEYRGEPVRALLTCRNNNSTFDVEIHREGSSTSSLCVSRAEMDGDSLTCHVDGAIHRVNVVHSLDSITVFNTEGENFTLDTPPPEFLIPKAEAVNVNSIVAPMTGRIEKILVEAGTFVKEGTPLVVMEAMKMEHVLKALTDGIVGQINSSVGDIVEQHSVIAKMEEDEE
eukprot:CFRG6454T1